MTEFQILQEIGRLQEENASFHDRIQDNEDHIQMLELSLNDLKENN